MSKNWVQVYGQKYRIFDGDCSNKDINKAYRELFDAAPKGSGETGDCNLNLYTNYTVNVNERYSLEQLKDYKNLERAIYNYMNVVRQYEQKPKITYFSPKKAMPGDKVVVSGKLFRYLSALYLNNEEIKLTSQTNDTLEFFVPSNAKTAYLTAKSFKGDTVSTDQLYIWSGICANADITRAIKEIQDQLI